MKASHRRGLERVQLHHVVEGFQRKVWYRTRIITLYCHTLGICMRLYGFIWSCHAESNGSPSGS